jgi:glycosyltransferase involved in cell wall biosynthesis
LEINKSIVVSDLEKPLVSVIIPIYNAKLFLVDAVETIKNQTWENIEIILVDDGSTDGSFEIAKSLESKKIIVLQQKNSGASAARNKGLATAKGEYIQFLDADDLLATDKIALQLAELIHNPNAVSFGDCIHFFKGGPHAEDVFYGTHEGFDKEETPINFIKKLYGGVEPILAGMIEIHAWLCPKSVIDAAGNWDEELTVDDDGEFFLRVVLAAAKVMYCPNAIVYYRKHEEASLSNTKGLANITSSAKSLCLKSAHLSKHGNDETLKRVMSKFFWQLAVRSYPEYKSISKKLVEQAISLQGKKQIPKLNIGNIIFDFIANHVSWKLGRQIQFYKQKLFRNK